MKRWLKAFIFKYVLIKYIEQHVLILLLVNW